jgi:hypothetical protein
MKFCLNQVHNSVVTIKQEIDLCTLPVFISCLIERRRLSINPSDSQRLIYLRNVLRANRFKSVAMEFDDVRIFPNPASGMFTIQLPQNEGVTTWNIGLFDLRGQLLESQTSQRRQVKLNAAKFSAGLYLIRVQSEGSTISKRVVIQ